MEQSNVLKAQYRCPPFGILTPGSEEDIEEVRREPLRNRSSHSPHPRYPRPPIRRRLHPTEPYAKTYPMFDISTSLDSRRSMDGSDISSVSALTMPTSAGSGTTDPWSSSGGFVEEPVEEAADFNWSEEEGLLLVPKLEPTEDDVVDINMSDFPRITTIKDSVIPETPSDITPTLAKRPRGRPRKHPRPTAESLSKAAKGRSKTGCITCRKRKKKCDEAKPGCLNCEKNSVTCEGYPEKTIWKSGKEKAEEGRGNSQIRQQGNNELITSTARIRRAGSLTLSNVQLPFLINGLETEGDRVFLSHYISRLSIIFTLEGEHDSAFRNILLPMAQQDSGLMHSILALSSKHIDYTSDYGQKVLADHPSLDVKTLEARSQFHQEEAIKELIGQSTDVERKAPSPALYAQMICLVLQTLSDPNPNGQHRVHLEHYQRLIEENPPEQGESMKFIHEFFQYHIHADQLIFYPENGLRTQYVPSADEWNLPSTVLQPSAVRLLGVFDGLFLYMSKITNIRNKIRYNLEHRIDPVLDYSNLHAAAEIDAGIREWTPAWEEGDTRDNAGLLYRQMMWIYLWRSVFPPQSTNWKVDPKITSAVNDGIAILSRFGPRDPSQTLALAPAFVIGCAAFEPEQREPIRKAIRAVKAYMEYKNSDTALEVLEEVWRLMDAKDERSWDWQAIASRMEMDFLAT